MTSSFETIFFEDLNVNDGTNFVIQDGTFTFTQAKKNPNWVDNPDADGAALADEPNYSNAEFAMGIRIVPRLTMDLALEAHGQIENKLQKASRLREQGGLAIPWTAAGSSREYTWYALLGELTDLPITVTGDLAGWFVRSPVIPVKLTCRPFGYSPERVILAPATSSTPIQVVEIPNVGGDVSAEARAIFTEKSTVDRRHLEWGLDQATGACLFTAASLSTTGYTGALKTKPGAYSSEKTIRAIALTQPTPLCGLVISTIGSLRIKARVQAAAATVRYRMAFRTGDGPWKTLPAVAPPVIGNWVEIDLGEPTFEEVTSGTQRGEVKVEQFTTEGTSEPDLNYLMTIPTTLGWGKARGLVSTKASSLLAYDPFEQTPSGNLEGKPLALGGNWTMGGKAGASGWQLDAAGHRATRGAVSDTGLYTGSYGIAGATSYGATQVSAAVSAPSTAGYGGVLLGLLARYLNVENWAMAAVYQYEAIPQMVVLKRVAGVLYNLNPYVVASSPVGKASLSVNSDGSWSASFSTSSGIVLGQYGGQDADFASGGALAAGKPGIYDACPSATAGVRAVDDFSVTGVEQASRVLYSGRKGEIRADSVDPVHRQDSTGTVDGVPISYRGDRLLLPVAGDTGLNSRLALKLRPNDVDLEPDSNVTLSQELEVRIAERVLAPR